MSKKTDKPNESEIEAFHQAMTGTKRFIQNKIDLISPKNPIRNFKENKKKSLEESFNFSEALDLPIVNGDEFIGYKHPSVPHKTLRKLRKGQYNANAVFDLHGMTVEKARIEVDALLHQCLTEGMRVILIIHGKGHHSGEAILKNKLNHWLRHVNEVLAFCSADNCHGNRGAIYVLLKRAKEEKFV